MFNTKIIEGAQSGSGEVAEFRMVALGLEFADDSDRNDDFMLFKSLYRTGVCQKY